MTHSLSMIALLCVSLGAGVAGAAVERVATGKATQTKKAVQAKKPHAVPRVAYPGPMQLKFSAELARLPAVRARQAAANPWLASQWRYIAPAAAMAAPVAAVAASEAPAAAPAAPAMQASAAPVQYVPRANPYLSYATPVQVALAVPSAPVASDAPPPYAASVTPSFGFSLPKLSLPSLPPLEDVSILPKITKVYPTGEKPLVVVSFKCPTEIIGIDTPSTKLLHSALNGGMDLLNKSDLLSFNMQQVCQ